LNCPFDVVQRRRQKNEVREGKRESLERQERQMDRERQKREGKQKKRKKKSRKLPTGTDEHTIELVFTRKKMRKKESARKRTRIYGE